MDDLPSSFFESVNGGYFCTALSRGPWDDGSAHGGPVAALVGREVERFDPDPDLVTIRFTIELLRPVPLGLLRLETTMARPGKRVQLIAVSITSDGTEVARAVVQRVRRAPADLPQFAPEVGLSFPPPEACGTAAGLIDGGVGITSAVELRSASGSALEPGPATYWFRVHASLVDDEPITPLSRALITADFGNGIASVLPVAKYVFINPDLTVHLHRLPDGEWVANSAKTWLEPGGAAVAEATLSDVDGPIGRATQSLYIATR